MIGERARSGGVGSKDFLPGKCEFAAQHLKRQSKAGSKDLNPLGAFCYDGFDSHSPLTAFASLQHGPRRIMVLLGDKTPFLPALAWKRMKASPEA